MSDHCPLCDQALDAEDRAADMQTSLDLAIADLRAMRAALTDLLAGAEEQSQSHVDVAERCREALEGAHEAR